MVYIQRRKRHGCLPTLPRTILLLVLSLSTLLSDSVAFHMGSIFPSGRDGSTKLPKIVSSMLFYAPVPESDGEIRMSMDKLDVNRQFVSPVLQQVAPIMLQWKQEYGHPNIPLKNPGGNQCQTLRRLHIQNKLTETEVKWLSEIGFIFHSMEDVYQYANFEELFQRLVAYQQEHPDDIGCQVPKKYPQDPELGAWVTGIRRLGKDGINPSHERKLDAIGFEWLSKRQCGSKFMIQYRELVERVEQQGGDVESVSSDPTTITWIQAQQEALKRGGLSQTRVHYMGNLFGDSWTTIGKNPGSSSIAG